MTKKSESRKARDADKAVHAAGSTCWDDLNAVYVACKHSIDNAAARLNHLYSQQGIKPFLENSKEIAINIRGVVDDRSRLHSRLESIHEKHASKTGGTSADKPDELVESMRIMGEYQEWQAHMEMAFMPSIEYLVSEFSHGYQRYVAHVKAAQEQAQQQEQEQAMKV